MSEIKNKKEISLSAMLIWLGITGGFIYGLTKAIIQINHNEYLSYKLYNLILFDIQKNTTTYTIISLLISIAIALLILTSKRILRLISHLDLSAKNKFNLLMSCSITIIIILGITYIYSLEIIAFLKSSNVTSWLGSFSSSKEETYSILITIIIFIGIYAVALVLFMKWQNRIEDISRKILDQINFNVIKLLGLVIVIAIFSFNLFIFGYKKLNSPEGPNIVLITIDTLRADRLGAYGYKKNTSPNIDKLAEKSVLFENAISQSPWTLPTMASIYTSLYPSEHGALNVDSRLNENFATLAELLKNNFYKTIGVVSQSFVSSKHGFSQGFEIFDENYISDVNDISSKFITDQAINYIEENQSESFFLWAHYFDPHHSYIDHIEFDYGSSYTGTLPKTLDIKKLNEYKSTLNDKDIEYVKNIYDEELSYTDKYIGDLINSLNEQGLEDNTIIIITADHGEEFLERTRFGHGKNLYQELIHVPLIVYVPDELKLRGKRIKNNVEIRSIPYTILDHIGIENNLFGGVNILSLPEQDTSAVFSEGSYAWGKDHRKEGIIYKNWKLIKNLDDQSYELYDMGNDPYEKRNLIKAPYPGDIIPVQDLQTQLSNFKKERAQESDKVKFNKEDVERLKALGYLQ